MKRAMSILLAAAMTAGLTACGGSGSAPEPAKSSEAATTAAAGSEAAKETGQSEAGGAVRVEYWHTMTGANETAINAVVQKFNETVGKDKGITVECIFQGDDINEKLKTLYQAKDTANFPDCAMIANAGIPSIKDYEQVIPTEDMYASGKDVTVKKEDLLPNAARAASYQDRMIAMPFNASAILLYYNKDMFKEVGLDPENPPATIADMADCITKLMQKDDKGQVTRYGLNVAVRRYQLANWIGMQGEYNFFGANEGGRTGMMSKVTFGEDGTLMNYLNEWDKVVKTGGYKEVEDNINEEFSMQLFGMAVMSSARIGKITSLVGDNFDWGTAYLPKVSADDKGGVAVGGSSTVMFDRGNPDVVDAAWIFTQYLTSPEAQYDFCSATGYIPVNNGTYDLDEMKTFLEENDKFAVACDELRNSNPNVQEPFDIINWEIDGIIRDNMELFGSGQQDIQTTHDNIVNDCNDKLSNYVRANQ